MADLSLAAPTIEGKDLLQRLVRIPEDLPPGPCILLFAFSPAQEREARTWLPALTDLALSAKLTVRQIIVLPGFAKFAEKIAIDEALKMVPPEGHDATIIAFADQGAVATSIGAADTKHIALALVDTGRRIVWTGSGQHTGENEAALRAQIAA
jgi:hypothetical protein